MPKDLEGEKHGGDGGRFDGRARISRVAARLWLTHEGEGGDGPSLAGFRDVLQRIAAKGSPSIWVEARDYVPEDLWMRAMAETSLPAVTSFEFGTRSFVRPDLGPLHALFACCPNLETVRIQGGGSLQPIEAPRLSSLKVWDAADIEEVGAALAASRFPRLRTAHLDIQTPMSGEHTRTFLEQAAPQLETLDASGLLAEEGFEALLSASTPTLRAVSVHGLEATAALEAIARHRIPSTWRRLSLSGPRCNRYDFEEAAALLQRNAEAFSALELFEFGWPLGDVRNLTQPLQSSLPMLRFPA